MEFPTKRLLFQNCGIKGAREPVSSATGAKKVTDPKFGDCIYDCLTAPVYKWMNGENGLVVPTIRVLLDF